MAITQAQYDAYEADAVAGFAARKGAKNITFADQSVTFDSWDEIWKWLAHLKAQIPVTATSSHHRFIVTSKGV